MKIGFDAKRLFHNFTGLGNYSRFVVQALSDRKPEHHYYLFTPRSKNHPEVDGIVSHSNVSIVTPPGLYRAFKASSLWRTFGISKEPAFKKLDIFHGLSHELPLSIPTHIASVVTIHDLIFIRYPELYNPIDVRLYKAKVNSACSRADRILATSYQTKQDIVEFLKVDPAKIDVVYQGCHPGFSRTCSSEEIVEVKSRYQIPGEYVLHVGTVEARKNVLLLIRALAMIPAESRVPLVIVGRATKYKDQIVDIARSLSVDHLITFLHGVSFRDLPAIYQGASLFVYPSFFEGFGIPIVEALESSVPVIAATGSCLSEAGGPGSVYVNPNDAEALAYQMRTILASEEIKKNMILAGKEHLKNFKPQVIADKLMHVYLDVIAR